uniref:Putative beta-tubulin folding cofactor e n=1 Tax=Culex tarsalis TaxID=7177 RepID=A0A1Q3EW57_CULTA
MAVCQVCEHFLCAEATVVRCNGRCQRRVHPWCSRTSGIMLVGNGNELYWFCDGCRRGLCPAVQDTGNTSGPLQDTLRKLTRRMDTMDDSLRRLERSRGGAAAGKPNLPDLPELPVEIWTEVFKGLSANQVLRIRLVCRRWKGIVDGSSVLMGKFTASFRDLAIDGDYEPVNLLPVFNVKFKDAKIRAVGTWWKAFGPSLTTIRIGKDCWIKPSVLMEMLKHVPNLKTLKLVNIILDLSFHETNVVPDFQLTKLEGLTIAGIEEDYFYEDVLKLCCNLKSLRFDYKNFAPPEAARSVAGLHNTLEELHLNATEEFLAELMELDRLKLKKLTLAGNEIEDKSVIIEFCKLQPDLEYLDVQDSLHLDEINEAYCNDFFQYFRKLEYLSICLGSNCQTGLTFLAHLTRLQSLDLAGRHQDYPSCLAACSQLPNLRQLKLRDINFPDTALQQWLTKVPNLRAITIKDCKFDCWSDLLEALESVKLLECATLKGITKVSETPFYYHAEFTALKSLHLSVCEMSPDFLGKLLGLCPGLREFRAKHVKFDAEKLGIVCRELTQLDKLVFACCKLPKNAKNYVRENCRSLTELNIS